jgi:hypothetical protein
MLSAPSELLTNSPFTACQLPDVTDQAAISPGVEKEDRKNGSRSRPAPTHESEVQAG